MKWLFALWVALPLSCLGQGVNQDLFDEINAFRKKRLLRPLEYTDKYQASTDAWAVSISKNFGHSFFDYYFGECISTDYPRNEIIQDFMDSEPHRKNLMSRKARKVCISVYEKDNVFHTVIRTFK